MSAAAAVTTANFESEVLQSTIPVLVDFWAEWCGPCLRLGPTIDSIAQEYDGKLKVVKVDVDAEPQLAAQYGVQGIPMLLFFKGGQVAEQMVGAYPKPTIVEKVKKVVE